MRPSRTTGRARVHLFPFDGCDRGLIHCCRIAPTAAERANQADRRRRLHALKLRGGTSCLQHGALCIEHVEIVHRAFRVLRVRQIGGALLCLQRFVLRLRLRFEYAQIGEAVLHFPKRDQHLLTILRNVLFIDGARVREIAAATSADAPSTATTPTAMDRRLRLRHMNRIPE